jgi:hypothetical protein
MQIQFKLISSEKISIIYRGDQWIGRRVNLISFYLAFEIDWSVTDQSRGGTRHGGSFRAHLAPLLRELRRARRMKLSTPAAL